MIFPFGCYSEIIRDIECNRCHEIYQSNQRGMAVMVNHSYMSICPDCTREVAAMMGFTPENISKHLNLIKYAETKNNKQYAIDHGEVCKSCEKKFKYDEERVRKSTASNVESWHLQCYGK